MCKLSDARGLHIQFIDIFMGGGVQESQVDTLPLWEQGDDKECRSDPLPVCLWEGDLDGHLGRSFQFTCFQAFLEDQNTKRKRERQEIG